MRFKALFDLSKKSIELDPWAEERGINGYAEELEKETDEVLMAAYKMDISNLKEELGDVLFDWMHICIHAEKQGLFTADEVMQQAIDKFSRRKPFLEEGRRVTKDEAMKIWKEVKQEEMQELHAKNDMQLEASK